MEKATPAIITAAQEGSSEAFGKLYDTYITKIFKFVYYKTHHTQTAEDLTSKVFLKALEKIKTYNSEKSAFSSWLYTIARNTVIDHYRTKKVHKDIEDVWDLSDNTDIEHDLDVTLEMDKVKEHMKGLKSTQRDIIIMRVWQGLRYKEIADILGKSEASCKMTYSRGMKALRESMALAVIMLIML